MVDLSSVIGTCDVSSELIARTVSLNFWIIELSKFLRAAPK